MVEFQVYAVHLEDRYPPAPPAGTTREEVAHDLPRVLAEATFLEKRTEGCLAFLFGRDAAGASVAVRVEGVLPCHYYALAPDEAQAIQQVKKELDSEVRHAMRDSARGVRLVPCEMAHCYGYEPDGAAPSGRKVHPYVRAEYPSLAAYNAAKGLRKDKDHGRRPAHETFVDPVTRFCADAGIVPGGWVRVAGAAPADVRVTTCDVELELADAKGLAPGADPTAVHAPYKVLYYDIETLALDPDVDKVIQVSLVVVAGADVQKHLVALGTVAPLPGIAVHECHSEADLLRKTRALVVEHDPDFVVAYNGVNFDHKYLAARASPQHAQHAEVDELFYLSRFALHKCRMREVSMTKAGRDYEFKYFDLPGRANLDWWVKFVTDDTSEPSQRLGHYAVKYCQDDKEDMPYKQIPILQAGDAKDRARLGSYCVHDSYLLHLLNVKRNIITEILGYAQVFGINPEWVYFRGQQVRFYSQVVRRVRTLEAVPLLLQHPRLGLDGEGEDTYEGATVNEPLRGYYRTLPVLCDDWKSLYPSTMMAHNLCYSTFVRDPAHFALPGVVAHEVRALGLAWILHLRTLPAGCAERPAPPALSALLARKKAEAGGNAALAADPALRVRLSYDEWHATKPAADEPAWRPTDAIRVGEESFLLPDAKAARTVHFATQQRGVLPHIIADLLYERGKAKKEVKKHKARAEALAKEGAAPSAVSAAEALAQQADARQLALKISCNSIYGVTGANKVGKWYCMAVSEATTFQGRKAMEHLKAILPRQFPGLKIIYGDSVAAHTPLLLRRDGREVVVATPATIAHAWRSTPDGKEAAVPSDALLETWTERGWSRVTAVFRHAVAKPLYRVVDGATGSVVDVTEDHSLLRAGDAAPLAPRDVTATTALLTSFPDLPCCGWTEEGEEEEALPADDPVRALRLYAQARAAHGAANVYLAAEGTRLRVGKPPPPGTPTTVRQLTDYADPYVYDLTTASGHFHAGVGALIVHNTDSIMYTRPDIPDMETCGRKGHEVSEFITQDYAARGYPQMELEFEKAYETYLLFKKKRYAGKKHEPGADGTMVFKGIDAKGIETERKDTLPFLKTIMREALHALLVDKDVAGAVAAVDRHVARLVRNEVPMDDLVLSQGLSSNYSGALPVHARVNDKRKAREAGSEESVGGRVEYIFLNGHKKAQAGDLAEDVAHAKAHNLALNRQWYLEHKIEKPLLALFAPVEGVDLKKAVFDAARVRLEAARLGVSTSLRDMLTSGGAGASASAASAAPPVRIPVPAPPARKKKKPK